MCGAEDAVRWGGYEGKKENNSGDELCDKAKGGAVAQGR